MFTQYHDHHLQNYSVKSVTENIEEKSEHLDFFHGFSKTTSEQEDFTCLDYHV